MKLKTFIDRPILSCAISVLILILGIIGLSNLPMEQYPDIAPPTIMVSTTYTGANAETVLKSVIAPLEEAINGVENMTYMTSTATNTGSASITVYFAQGTDPDMGDRQHEEPCVGSGRTVAGGSDQSGSYRGEMPEQYGEDSGIVQS